jgi:hypothetical protein
MEQEKQTLQPYTEPTLTEYGDIREITQGATAGVNDGAGSQVA